ncbi:MAG: DUF4403 family protein, partial [Gemmatimonadetes bacterium]|nr:DUF4403 family protein [Gemmatimonadota bacterium]
DTVDAAARLAPLPPSLLSVPVDLDLAPMIAEMERQVPAAWGDLENRLSVAGNDRLEVAFSLSREPFRASFEDSVARVATTIAYRARAWYDPPVLPTVSASCGTGDDEAPPRLDVALIAPLTLDREWRLHSRVAVDVLVPRSETDRDRCRVTVIRWDMTERVVDEARRFLENQASGLDSLLADIDLRSRFEEWWSVIAEPVELAEDVWMVLAPEGLVRGPIRGYGEGVQTILGLRARPRLVVGPRPAVVATALPPLDSGFVAPGFAVRVEARAEYDEASSLLDRELSGRTLTRGDRTVRLEGFEVSGIGRGRLAVAVDLGGDARGRLYLVGTPRYDPEDGRIGVPDLDFDVASGRALVEGAAWVARVGLVGLLRDAARWPASPAVSWAQGQVERGLNRSLSERVRLEGRVASVDVVDVVAGLDALLVRADVRAEATLRVAR